MTKIYFVIVLLTTIFFSAKAQNPNHSKIKLIAFPTNHSILLRWAVSNSSAWEYANSAGFLLERYTVVKDNQILPTPLKINLGNGIIKAQPKEKWFKAKDNKYAAIIAQAMFGKSFNVTGSTDFLTQLSQKNEELQQRFTLSLYASDQSFEAAELAGWGFEDKEAIKGEKYLYRIKIGQVSKSVIIDSGFIFIGIDSAKDMPKPLDFSGIWGNKAVILKWSNELLKDYYHSYVVEKRAKDNDSFKQITNLPITNINNKEKKSSKFTYYVDSLKENEKDYQYRIKGLNSFGIFGPYSNIIQGKGKTLLEYTPNIDFAYVNSNGILETKWVFDSAGNEMINGFELRVSATVNGIYKSISSKIPPQQREMKMKFNPYSTNYFVIYAIAKNGEGKSSLPYLFQPEDSIAPDPPKNIVAKVDSLGRIQMSWEANTEKDLMGYRVFRSNSRNEEMALLTPTHFTKTIFKDTINLKNLNKKIFYAIVALDKRYNQSKFSEIVEIKRPDIVPPSPPIITDYKYFGNDSLQISFEPSSDEDVAQHSIYRKDINTQNTVTLKTFSDSTKNFIDTSWKEQTNYIYWLTAKDSSGLVSVNNPILNIKTKSKIKNYIIYTFKATIFKELKYIELYWKDDFKNKKYEIYKAENDKPLSSWKLIEINNFKRIADSDIRIGSIYTYAIRVVEDNGKKGKFTYLRVEY